MTLLPKAYQNRMRTLLGDGYEAFLRSYDEAPKKGLRFHPGKARPETIAALTEAWHLRPVPWCETGYYYEEDGPYAVRPGKSPYHDAGLYYIQEPSAMMPVEEAAILAGERVLDLCAAPGGKSTQAASRAGILVANEYVRKRALILSSNIERMGLRNVIVTNAAPARLAAALPGAFDCVLCDAPCSGEGMMRKDETAISEWSEDAVRHCAARQAEILDAAYQLLSEGGRLCYSTCTFEPEENELQIRALLARCSDLTLLSETRILPHLAEGEGQYCAVLRKGRSGAKLVNAPDKSAAFRRTELLLTQRDGSGSHEAKSMDEALLCEELLRLAETLRRARIPVLRAGVTPGTLVKGQHKGAERYEPSHAESHAMTAGEIVRAGRSLNLLMEEPALSYLRGESLRPSALPAGSCTLTLPSKDFSGFLPVCYDGYPLGFGKYVSGVVKNHLPKGLRRF